MTTDPSATGSEVHDVSGLPGVVGYTVRRVPAFRASKAYVCPDCANPILGGVGHVVAWPDDTVDDRRHWHLHCWRLASRRGRIA